MSNHVPHPNHDRGLEFDLSTLMSRRSLGMFFGAGGAAAALAACTPGGSGSTAGTPSSAATESAAASAATSTTATSTTSPTLTRAIAECGVGIPEETAGPYPGDGSNGPNVLTASGVVRQDITTSFGTGSAKAEGVPLTFTLTLLDNANGCVPLSGAAVYAWHCDREGRYSLYDSGLSNENYLRGVQEADANGQVTFTSVFPGAYSGRWPHIHFEVFASMSNATAAGQVLAVSQIALTKAACDEVYATPGYEDSVVNMNRTTLQSDNVFGDDGGIYQLATMTGSAATGYTAGLNVTL
ncbi:intradiol ring-cleavage dioxygenase [Pseudarthrobacter sulfonivorans]|uniref:intradiol ring-cleavage dioxygenase n=1 Tax=Pseudarthrobacter sulfonivorans TaxID=121292 RepID=UPI002858C8AC|nr:intradiol ring-cleavage dioxygenase [Pseudarthrobacter sulfonivorans]MDR6416693.1 protocatechuate 3,4-dioxygenase beta subunit [Pseudarthrobacter sulfonivorans]